MRPFALIALAGLLALCSSALQAADVKPIVVNPSTGLNTTMQPGMRLSVPTASGGFLVTTDPGVQTATRVLSYPVLVGGDTFVVLGIPQTFSGKITFPASTTSAASINLPPGVAPSAPVNGDLWTTASGLFARINGSTQTIGVGNLTGSLTAPRIPFASGTSALTDASTLTYSATTGLHTSLGSGSGVVSVGTSAGNPSMSGSNNTLVGEGIGGALTIGNFNTVIGQGSLTQATGASGHIVIGQSAANTLVSGLGQSDIIIGNGADVDTTSRQNALVIGGTAGISNTFIGNGIISATPGANTINGTGGSGSDIAGAAVTIAGGRGTGSGVGGAVIVQTAPHSTTGSTANSLAEVARFSEQKNFLIGTTTDPTGTFALKVVGETFTAASTTTNSGLNIPHGTAPSAPVNGDLWSTTAGFFGRVNGATVGPFGAGGGSGFPVSTTTYAVQDTTTATKQQEWNLSNMTANTILTLGGNQSTSQTINFPNATATDTVATLGLGNAFTGSNTWGTSTTPVAITEGVATSGTPPIGLSYVGGAHTGLSSGVAGSGEVVFDGSQTKQWTGTTTVATYTFMAIKPPVLASTSATTTFSNPATLTITGVPTAGANASVTGARALTVTGNAEVDGKLTVATGSSQVSVSQAGFSGAVPAHVTITGGAATSVTAGANLTQFALNYAQSEQHATGAITENSTVLISAPTLTAVGASVATDAALLTLSGAPVISTNLTTTNQPSALWAKGGQIRTDGNFMASASAAPSILQDGQFWTDSTQVTHTARLGGISTPLTGTICTTSGLGTVANTTTETSLFGTLVGTKTLPANFLKVGKTIRIHIAGICASTVTPTLVFRAKLGTTTYGVTLGTLTLTNLTTNSFVLDSSLVCLTTGATGTVQAAGISTIANGTTSAYLNGFGDSASHTVDTTASQVIDVTAQWSTAAVANTISSIACTVEILN